MKLNGFVGQLIHKLTHKNSAKKGDTQWQCSPLLLVSQKLQ
ncbi:MAG: hypothetical protein GFH27_549285n330 [Chloroflexi bacterium AL-W]|nr:hypothetical protein [Chloroflexi bacterium AL-N1]NOK65841.1 hypothetical protein [Chloroflexi bacterium AL-N10]NOK74218.1 hypothetical protein [Chloroflexi bacterium AL-N5]NOK80874.1 hypothetical protein [Chloroflexi bacterium AL-W]NOK88476.1 hypothetical protein [Chloroflexi bacterium AL-N15]